MAMLGKQIWRLMSNPHSLCARVFKSKYFSRISILNAYVGVDASYVWRSLGCVIPLVESGCIWTIGNGWNIDIWQDLIPKSDHRFIVSPRPLIAQVSFVSNLINLSARSWD